MGALEKGQAAARGGSQRGFDEEVAVLPLAESLAVVTAHRWVTVKDLVGEPTDGDAF